MVRGPNAHKRHRRERGSINPDDIIDGALELAEKVSIDNLSMTSLSEHLGVGVTSIYWYFRKKEDLLAAMTTRALRSCVFPAPHIDATRWRESLSRHARATRKAFLSSPILTDLIFIRGALGVSARRLGVEQMEQAMAALTEAGLSLEEALDTVSAVTLHVRGSVVLERLNETTLALHDDEGAPDELLAADPDNMPLVAELSTTGRRIGVSDLSTFEYGLRCILDQAQRIIDERAHMRRDGP